MTKRDDLRELIKQLAIIRGKVTLASGREADYYVDMRAVTLDGRSAPLVGRVMLEVTADWDFDCVGGLTMGADPVALAMVHCGVGYGNGLDAFVVRKEAKGHGLQKRIEGPSVAGRRCLVVEDTSTTGGSPLTAVKAIREAGGEVVGVAVVVDRAAGAAEAIRDAGLPYRYAYDLADLGLD
ncbi:MAG: orotate phosphoribosyltransferase [Propionibacteriaceae bacterium]|jgi:orotate phosphoribosyltransferase|nr:orotate phosphoribosyltransferase [Propionibacteriaceae bacterium]